MPDEDDSGSGYNPDNRPDATGDFPLPTITLNGPKHIFINDTRHYVEYGVNSLKIGDESRAFILDANYSKTSFDFGDDKLAKINHSVSLPEVNGQTTKVYYTYGDPYNGYKMKVQDRFITLDTNKPTVYIYCKTFSRDTVCKDTKGTIPYEDKVEMTVHIKDNGKTKDSTSGILKKEYYYKNIIGNNNPTACVDFTNKEDAFTISGAGTWKVTVNATDIAGNFTSTSVNVLVASDKETQAPVIIKKPTITLTPASVSVELGGNYVDSGVTAKDSDGVIITNRIVASGKVNTNIAGNYALIYNVKDFSGNSNRVVRTVTVKPLIQYSYRTSSPGVCPEKDDVCMEYKEPSYIGRTCPTGSVYDSVLSACKVERKVETWVDKQYTCSDGQYQYSHYTIREGSNNNTLCDGGSTANGVLQNSSRCTLSGACSGDSTRTDHYVGSCSTIVSYTTTPSCDSTYTYDSSIKQCYRGVVCSAISCPPTWSSWSEWNKSKVSETDTKQVKVRTILTLED